MNNGESKKRRSFHYANKVTSCIIFTLRNQARARNFHSVVESKLVNQNDNSFPHKHHASGINFLTAVERAGNEKKCHKKAVKLLLIS